MIRKFSYIIILFITVQVSAQPFNVVWSTAMKPFYQDCFDIEIGVNIYKNAMKLNLLEAVDLRYRKCDRNMLLTSQEYDQLITEKVLVLADHREKALMLGPVLNGKGATPRIGLDSLLKLTEGMFDNYGFYDPEKQYKAPDGSEVFVFEEPNDHYHLAEFWFNSQKTRVTKIVLLPSESMEEGLEPNEIPLVEYRFTYRDEIPPRSLFAIDQYVVKTAGGYSPIKKYSSYILLNQL